MVDLAWSVERSTLEGPWRRFAGEGWLMADGEAHETLIHLDGPIRINESNEIRATLLAALGEGKPIRIDLAAAGPWDIAGLQLLVSAVASGQKAGLAVRLIHVPGVCVEVAHRAALGDWLESVTDSLA